MDLANIGLRLVSAFAFGYLALGLPANQSDRPPVAQKSLPGKSSSQIPSVSHHRPKVPRPPTVRMIRTLHLPRLGRQKTCLDSGSLTNMSALKKYFLEAVKKRIDSHGFGFRAKDDCFIKRNPDVQFRYMLVFKDGRPGQKIQPNVAVRVERVEEIFNRTSGIDRKYQSDTLTMGTPVGALIGSSIVDCEFFLNELPEVETHSAEVARIFETIALPYFKQWSSLDNIDAELNEEPLRSSKHRGMTWTRCSTGLIVAKLVGRSDYESLAAEYLKIMARDNGGFYMKRFALLVEDLKAIVPGTRLNPVVCYDSV